MNWASEDADLEYYGLNRNSTYDDVKKVAMKLHSASVLECLDERARTKDLCELAVNANGSALRFVPEHLKTKDMCMKAVKDFGGALEFVPENWKTQEMCLIAVRQYNFAIKYVPEHLKTLLMYINTIPLKYLKSECTINLETDFIYFLSVLGSIPEQYRATLKEIFRIEHNLSDKRYKDMLFAIKLKEYHGA
jgi:hypothetical protein